MYFAKILSFTLHLKDVRLYWCIFFMLMSGGYSCPSLYRAFTFFLVDGKATTGRGVAEKSVQDKSAQA